MADAVDVTDLGQDVKGYYVPYSVESDSFWSKRNQERLAESLKELKDGRVVIKTSEELKAMENG
jgi:hypothetical protein